MLPQHFSKESLLFSTLSLQGTSLAVLLACLYCFFWADRRTYFFSCRSFIMSIFFFPSWDISLSPGIFLHAPWNKLCYAVVLEQITAPVPKFFSHIYHIRIFPAHICVLWLISIDSAYCIYYSVDSVFPLPITNPTTFFSSTRRSFLSVKKRI